MYVKKSRARHVGTLISLLCMAPIASNPINAQEDVSAPEMRVFGGMDVFNLEYASDPQISPDGSQIVYVRASNDIMKDGTRSNIWIINADGSEHRPLFSGRNGYYSPRWSPDGKRLAYITAAEGSPQLYVRWMDTGQTAMITDLTESPSSMAWSPDGEQIAFTMSVDAAKSSMVSPRPKPEGAEWSPAFNVIDSVLYRFDGQGYIKPAFSHVFVVPSDGGSARQLSKGDFQYQGPITWSPDSREILVSSNQRDDWEYEWLESNVYAINVSSATMTQITSEDGTENDAIISPDGTKLAYIKESNVAQTYRTSYITVANRDGSSPRTLAHDLDRSVEDLNWSEDSQGLYFGYTDHGIGKVGYVSLADERSEVVANAGGLSLGRPYTAAQYSVAKNGRVAFTFGTSKRPADLATSHNGQHAVLTELNEDTLGTMELAEVKNIRYMSSVDGIEIEGWYLLPPGFDPTKKYPLILEIHGGPNASYGPYFSAEMQLMASAGYVVFYDNHRGSTSYGEDFAMLIQNKYSSPDDFGDHMSGVDAMIDMGFIDENNLFITGGSAGGIATAYAVGLTDRFNAAVAAKPVINWISKTLTGDSYTYQIPNQFPGMPWEEFEHYWQRSPMSLVGNVTTPTMLMTGEEDYRTPISESEQFYQALKLRRIDTALVRIPGSSHGIANRPSRLISKVDHILAWFERYKKDGEATE